MFLDEHVWAPMMMSVTLIVALLGVLALGAYVVYCDRQNRAGEKDLGLIREEGAGPADHHSMTSVDTVEPVAAPATAPPVTARSISRRRKAGTPPES